VKNGSISRSYAAACENGAVSRAKIFIASSGAGLNLAQAVYALLGHRHDPLLWNAPGVFPASAHPMEALEAVARDAAFAVFVATADDMLMLGGGAPRPSVRDNVLVEYGLFVGALGRRRCFFLISSEDRESSRIPTDLLGLTMFAFGRAQSGANTLELQAVVHDACGKIEHQIGQVLGDEHRALRRMRESTRKDERRKSLGALSATIVTLRGTVSALQKATLENITESDGFEEAKSATVRGIRSLAEKHEAAARELGVGNEFDNLIRKVIGLVETAPYPVRFTGLPQRLVQSLWDDVQDIFKGSTTKEIGKSIHAGIEREIKETVEGTWKEYADWWDRASLELRDAADAATEAIDRRKEDLVREASLAELRRALPHLRLRDTDPD
jgi:predicted nucleotide-binding protein